MGFVSVVSSPAIQWQLQYTWPTFRALATNTFSGRGGNEARYPLYTSSRMADSANASNINEFGPTDHATGGGTTFQMRIDPSYGIPHHFSSITTAGSDRYVGEISGNGFPIVPTMPAGDFRPGFEFAELYRVQLLRAAFKIEAGATPPALGCGIGLQQYTGQNLASGEWPDQVAALCPGGIVIVGDGAGGLEYRSTTRDVASPANIRNTIAIPSTVAELEKWNWVEFQIRNADTQGTAASIQTRINGTLIVEDTFGAAPLMETPAFPTVFGFQLAWSNNGTTQNGQIIRVGPVECFQGRFTRLGQEV